MQSLSASDGVEPSTIGARPMNRVLKQLLEARAESRSLLLHPVIERRFAKLSAVEKVAPIQSDRALDTPRGHVSLELDNIDNQAATRSKPESITVVWDELIAKRGTQAMQRLPKGIASFVLGDAAPKEIHNLVAPHLSSNDEIGQQRQRLAPAERSGRLTCLIHQGRNAQDRKTKGRACNAWHA
jgi:hypothetical protein